MTSDVPLVDYKAYNNDKTYSLYSRYFVKWLQLYAIRRNSNDTTSTKDLYNTVETIEA